MVQRVMARIDLLAENPYPASSVELSGAERLYRLRAGEYRIIYAVDVKGKRSQFTSFGIGGRCIEKFRFESAGIRKVA